MKLSDFASGTMWAVAEGEYSDYHVIGVCASEETANALADAGGFYVQELQVYDSVPTFRTVFTGRKWPFGMYSYQRKDEVSISRKVEWGIDEEFHNPAKFRTDGLSHRSWRVEASGTDKERVIKSVKDKYTSLIHSPEMEEAKAEFEKVEEDYRKRNPWLERLERRPTGEIVPQEADSPSPEED